MNAMASPGVNCSLSRNLTVKLSGRPMPPDQRRGCKLLSAPAATLPTLTTSSNDG
jgi:hypothetical protein